MQKDSLKSMRVRGLERMETSGMDDAIFEIGFWLRKPNVEGVI